VSELYLFLSIYNGKLIPSPLNNAVLEECSFLTSEDDQDRRERMQRPKTDTIGQRRTGYNFTKEKYLRIK
jgi:hypothetical protein